MSRPTNTPEDASGMRCLGCGYYDDEPQAQRMCEAGEGAGHAFVRVGPDGCVPAPDDDPATLRARLEKRYERPERPCTYDPADEEPEGDWTPPRPEPVEYSGIPVVVDPEQEEGTVILVWKPPTPAGIVWTRDTLDAWQARHDAATEVARTHRPASEWMDLAVAPQGGPTFTPPRDHTAREANVIAESIGWPKVDTTDARTIGPIRVEYIDAKGDPTAYSPGPTVAPPMIPMTPESAARRDAERAHFAKRYPEIMAEVLGTGPAIGRPGLPYRILHAELKSLRSYLRTLTNPDATPEEVNGALDALTPEDRALVSEALPSWGSARMSRVEAIAPFMARFETMVRERDPRANEEGTLLLSALREDDPTRSTVEALMEIAKTPKVTP